MDTTRVREVVEASPGCVRLFVSGAVSHVGKSTVCMGLLGFLEACGIPGKDLSYIKPSTQCEAVDLVQAWCAARGIRYVGGADAPLVFYPGLTRAVIAGEIDVDVDDVVDAVDVACQGKRFCVIDGVGFPGVGSCVGLSNADVARACGAPVVLVGKAGVGSAIDTHCLDCALFERAGVPVLGAIFNLAPTDGFYAAEKIRQPLETFFARSRPRETCYGVVPSVDRLVGAREKADATTADAAVAHLMANVDFRALVEDTVFDVYNRRPSRRVRRRPSSQNDGRGGGTGGGGAAEVRSAIEARARESGAVRSTS